MKNVFIPANLEILVLIINQRKITCQAAKDLEVKAGIKVYKAYPYNKKNNFIIERDGRN